MKLMRPVIYGIAVQIFFLLPVAKAQERPNIIFIIGDDISLEDIGCYGNTAIRTPNIDLLARAGSEIQQCFCNIQLLQPRPLQHYLRKISAQYRRSRAA